MTDSPVEDVHAIQELNARYNFAVDETDGPAWADCFTSTGVFNALLPGQTPTGTEELVRFMSIVTEAFGRMHHLTTNEIITVSGNEATQKCYLLFFSAKDGRTEGTICEYNDALEKTDSGWKYSRRDVTAHTKIADFTAVTEPV